MFYVFEKQPKTAEIIGTFRRIRAYRQFHSSSTPLLIAINAAGRGKMLVSNIGLKTDSADETRLRNKNSRNVS